jgi:TolB-like protein
VPSRASYDPSVFHESSPPPASVTTLPQIDVRPAHDQLGDADREEAEAALARLLDSEAVRGSRRTAAFLAFTVGEALAGRGHELRERRVAAGAFGRGAGFDPRIDPVVRVQARRVRAALARHYAGPGAFDPLRIELPVGGYAPVFRRVDPWAPDPEARGHGPADVAGVAVVALANLTPGGADDLAPGLSETLVAGLAPLPGVRIVGPVASAGDADPTALRRRHGVRFVLTGSTRVRGMAVRVSVRLVDARDGATVWSAVVDGRLDARDPFAIEDRVVARAAAAVAGRQAGAPPRSAAAGRTTRGSGARAVPSSRCV